MTKTSRARRRGAFTIAFLCAALLLAAQARPAGGASFEALFAPDPELGRIGGLAEPLPLAELSRAALLASIAPGPAYPPPPAAALEAYGRRLEALLEGLAAELGGIADPLARAEAALVSLHEGGVFKAYAERATGLPEILDAGRFNCVSSAVLYLLALKRLGIEAAGVKTLDHAFVLVRAGGREVDVETTSRYGFDPGQKKAFTDEFGRVTGFSYVPPGSYGRRWTIGERALLSLILSNRAAFLEEGRRYAEALSLGASLDALLRDREGRDFLLDRVNNLAAELGGRRDFEAAEAFVLAARAAFGPEPALEALLRTASYNRAASLAERRRWAEALETAAGLVGAGRGSPELLELARGALHNLVGERLQARDYRGAREAAEGGRGLVGEAAAGLQLGRIAEAELAEAVQSRPFAEALALAEAARGRIDSRRLNEFLVFIYGSEAQRRGRSGDWLGAAELAEEGSRALGREPSLAQAASAFRRNFAAEAHNRFAALFNARRYAEARAEVEAALRRLPGDPGLLEDLALARRFTDD